MRINLDWLMGLLMVGLMVGVPFGFEWYNNPRYVKALVKALFTVIQLAGGVLGVFFIMANCQVKCDTSCKKTSIADFQPRHFRGLELIRNRLCISSISFTRERSVFLG